MFRTYLVQWRCSFLCFSPTGVFCISVLVWVWAWAVWRPGSPLALWATPVWEAPPSSPGFSWAWSWSWSSPRCWGFTASSWPSSYLQNNKCPHQTPSHSFHIKAARTNRRFSPTFHYTPWVWQDGMATETSWLDSGVLSRRDLSILFKAIQLCQVSWVLNGHEDVLVVVGWCVDSLLDYFFCLILTCTVIQSPATPCKCSNQSVLWVWVSTFIPLPIPLLLVFVFCCWVWLSFSISRLLKIHAH